MFRLVVLCTIAGVASALVQRPSQFGVTHPRTTIPLFISKQNDADEVVQQRALPVGTFAEFQEKKRTHIGKIEQVEHKSSGGARYLIESEGKKFDIADKDVTYSMPCPNSPGQAEKLFDEFVRAQDAPVDTLQDDLDITPELLEMAWEEAAEDDGDHLLTASSLIELVQGHAASAMEKYLAWRLLKTELAHVFFKEIKDHGKVVAFKAKTRRAVDDSKAAFCATHADNALCFV